MKKQAGLTIISWIIIIAFLLFQAVMAMNIIPVYIADSSVKSVMQQLPLDAEVRDKPPQKIQEVILKRLKINSVYDIKADHIKIKKVKGAYQVTIEYAPRGKLIGNLDYIATFKHEIRIPTR